MNVAFFYRTRQEYDEVCAHVKTVNAEMRESVDRLRNRDLLRINTRYITSENWDTKIPKKRVGTKKYAGIIGGNKHLMNICGVRPEEFLKELGREVVSRIPGKSKYDGERTTHSIVLQTHQEFRTITSVFNKRYGHGNWRIQGPKKLQHILKQIEPTAEISFFTGSWDSELYNNRYPNGIKVTLVVNESNANIKKQLFKAVLKG